MVKKLNKKCIVLVVGLPASGKSHYALDKVNKLLTVGLEAQVLDDPRTPGDLTTGLESFKKSRASVLYVTDPYLCKTALRQKAQQDLQDRGFVVRCVYFENNEKQCLSNAMLRPDKRVTEFIRALSKGYTPGKNALKVYCP